MPRTIFRSASRDRPHRGGDFRSRRNLPLSRIRRRQPVIPSLPNAPQRRAGKGARYSGTTQAANLLWPLFSSRAYLALITNNAFSLHNTTRKGKEETFPITVKASHELSHTLVSELKKGVGFVVEGQLAYYKSPETNRETY